MQFLSIFAPILVGTASAFAFSGFPISSLSNANGTFLEMTAIVTQDGNSVLACWRLEDPFTTSTGAGTVGASTLVINDLANATYTVIPPRFEGGIHNAPHPQLVVFLSGVAHVTLPYGTNDAYVVGGPDGTIIAVDVTGTGHNTSYPSNMETRSLQIAFTDGIIPPHEVLNAGACNATDQVVTTSERVW